MASSFIGIRRTVFQVLRSVANPNNNGLTIESYLLVVNNRSTYLSWEKLAAGEGVEPSSSESKSDVLPVALSRKIKNEG